jgi:hypothetical protein
MAESLSFLASARLDFPKIGTVVVEVLGVGVHLGLECPGDRGAVTSIAEVLL